MKKILIIVMAVTALLTGCDTRNRNIMRIESQGSFAVGGIVLADSLGHRYHGDHAYVLSKAG